MPVDVVHQIGHQVVQAAAKSSLALAALLLLLLTPVCRPRLVVEEDAGFLQHVEGAVEVKAVLISIAENSFNQQDTKHPVTVYMTWFLLLRPINTFDKGL